MFEGYEELKAKLPPRSRFYSHTGRSVHAPIRAEVYQWDDTWLGRLCQKIGLDTCGKVIGYGYDDDSYYKAYTAALNSARGGS